MENVKMICFDMDGTIADLYAVNGWNEMLRAEDPTPYAMAKPLYNMERLANILNRLRAVGVEIRVITWLSMNSTEEYKNVVRQVKRDWLAEYNFPFDNFHGIAYGTTKADSVRKYLNENENAWLIDDNKKVRSGWTLGRAIDPTEGTLLEILEELLV